MNFKLWSVSSICFLWAHSLPQRAIQRQQGGEAGAGLAPMLVSLFPTTPGSALLPPHCSSCRTLALSLSAFVKHFTNSSSASGSCALVYMDWELERLRNWLEWFRSCMWTGGSWSKVGGKRKMIKGKSLDLSEYIGFLLSQAVSSLSRTSPSHLPMWFLTFKIVGAASKMCLQHFQKW